MEKQCTQTHEEVKQYYGETLCGTDSLQTNASCIAKSCLTPSQKKAMSMLNEEITSKFYGCGSPIPACLQGATIVDLGCGTGVDTYISSYFAGETGTVIGVDMTAAQLEIAGKYVAETTQKFGFQKPNVKFIESRIEKIPLEDNTADVVISNCVINLCPSKKDVFTEIRRILKPGGELYFSDLYASLRINQKLRSNKVLWGEGLAGALYIEDFRRIMDELGFKDLRVMSKSEIIVNNPKIQEQCKGIKYHSITYRCFKLDDLEDRPQDYGQKARYLGGVQEHEEEFRLDSSHVFKKGVSVEVCGNTASMLKRTRLSKYFEVDERGEHRGLFNSSKDCLQQPCSSGACC